MQYCKCSDRNRCRMLQEHKEGHRGQALGKGERGRGKEAEKGVFKVRIWYMRAKFKAVLLKGKTQLCWTCSLLLHSLGFILTFTGWSAVISVCLGSKGDLSPAQTAQIDAPQILVQWGRRMGIKSPQSEFKRENVIQSLSEPDTAL